MSLFDAQSREFQQRHLGPNENETSQMLKTIGVGSLEELVNRTVPPAIRMKHELDLPPAMSENQYLEHIKEISLKNQLFKNYIGQGYYDTITPSVILRNVFENPGWYTQYTPYQAEIVTIPANANAMWSRNFGTTSPNSVAEFVDIGMLVRIRTQQPLRK
mgnify:CR=1 FL=1